MSRIIAAAAGILACILLSAIAGPAPRAEAMIHTAPIVMQGLKVKPVTHYPINMYRLFRTDAATGKAMPIPFQIDEINEWGDYVLSEGGQVTAKTGNGIFDLQDEIAFMGDDVGPIKQPTAWDGGKPSLVFEIKISFKPKNGEKNEAGGDPEGAVYLAVYFQNPPPVTERSYVNFNRQQAEVITSRYRYGFDQKNWLVARRVEMLKQGTDGKPEFLPLLDSTTFYMKADLKYFLTVEANHRSIDSALEAYKTGPVRSIVRISFHYTFLKLNFELGMYTEVSFFSNAVYLPAILYNPLDGKKSLNSGSGFYYGMSLKDNPAAYKIESNMPAYKKSGILDMFSGGNKAESLYWITASGNDRMLYMEISPSKEMRAAGAIPMVYKEDKPGAEIKDRNKEAPSGLGASPVNMALYFDMTKFSEGEHIMAFRLFFENSTETKRLQSFKQLSLWDVQATRLKN